MKTLFIEGFESLPLSCYLYDEVEDPRGVILIIHGMQEHALRYEYFAKKLCESGFIVLASDLRAHGKTAKDPTKLGYNDGDIYKETVNDQIALLKYLHSRYDLPIYVFAHSYGSMVAQTLMQKVNIAKKYVLCGTANGSSFLFRLADFVSGFLCTFARDKKASFVEGLSFKAYAKKFEDGNWFTRDKRVFENYKKDPLCGGSFPYSFYHSLFSNMTRVNRKIKLINNDTKILLIAGDHDPIGEYGKQVKKLAKIYAKKGKNVENKIYKDCRHELVNELNRDQIITDIIDFYNK